MINLGSFRAGSCQGISRRPFLKIGTSLPIAYGLSNAEQLASAAESAKAKSVLLIWLWGAPSHLDLCDPKPNAPVEYRGPFATIQTRIPGVHFTELLPRLAERSDRFSLVRSNINFNGDHFGGGRLSLSGATEDGLKEVPPNFGSILARHRKSAGLPGFVSLARGLLGSTDGSLLEGYGGGPWGIGYDPFMVSCSATGKVAIPQLNLLEGLTPTRLSERRTLLRELDHVKRFVDSGTTDGSGLRQKDVAQDRLRDLDRLRQIHLSSTADVEKWDISSRRAYELLTSGAASNAFDLSRESAAVRADYGQTEFGQSCLLGRRLVEAGIPYVQVNWSQTLEVHYPNSDNGWDTHADNFELLSDWHGPLLDRVLPTLLDDLEQRGLLETTLVVCLGEFGRTPRINNIGSRDHWPQCYFSIWAGAGIKPGRVIGESDALGQFPLTDPVPPAMVGTTILDLAGVSTEARAELKVLEGGRLIDGLL
ncbi:MAG: DUF1501 domain-containing protein [Fuerstiella sp.]|nr:DUF1501 domain-containing protein [Fuerstiella sp.]